MKAAVITGISETEKIKICDVETPKSGTDEVLLKVLYCGINHLDVLIKQGKRPGPKTFPHVLGSEIVGQIVESGDVVCVYPWIFCGKCTQCKGGNENICDNGGTFGRTRWGGYAEYVTVPVKNSIKLPSDVAPQDAASVILAGTTAHHLINRAGVTSGKTVLVTGATGGVGTVVIQLLRAKNCTVISTTSHPQKEEQLINLGVDVVVSTEHMTDEILSMYPNGIDYVIDIVGGSIWSKAVETLGKNGTIVFCSTSRDEKGIIDIGKTFHKQLNILGCYGGTRKDMKETLTLVSRKILNPVIDHIYPLRQAEEAHQKIENQKVFGKVLLSVTS